MQAFSKAVEILESQRVEAAITQETPNNENV